MTLLTQDVRHAARGLRRTPGFALVVVLTLALGIGANAAVFGLLDGVLLAPLPYPDVDRLVSIRTVRFPSGAVEGTSLPDLRDWEAQASSFDAMAAFFVIPTQFPTDGAARPIRVGWTSTGYFEVFRVAPLVGTTLPADAYARGDAAFAAVLSHRLWQDAFGADRAVVGRTVRMYERTFRIVGVMPASFDLPEDTDLWAPMQALFEALNVDPRTEFRDRRWQDVVARLRPGVSLQAARDELLAIGERLARQYPCTNDHRTPRPTLLREAAVGDMQSYLWLALATVGVILAMSCANLVSLVLARGTTRGRELAVRAAIGAGREDLVRLVVTEQLLLAAAGGLLGLGLGAWLLQTAVQLMATDLPSWAHPMIDWRVAGYGMSLAFVNALVASAASSRQWSARALQVTLRSSEPGGRGWFGLAGSRARAGLVVAQVALAVPLVVAAGLLLRTLLGLERVETGFDKDQVLVGLVVPDPDRFRQGLDDDARRRAYLLRVARYQAFYSGVLDQLNQRPDVVAAAGASRLPYQEAARTEARVTVRGDGAADVEQRAPAMRLDVSGRYFEALRIPLLRGRTFDETDTADRPWAVVVSARTAETLWPGREALGQQLKWGSVDGSTPWATVVGVAGNVRYDPREGQSGLEVYYAYTQVLPESLWFVVRTETDPSRFAPVLRDVVAAIDPRIAVAETMTMSERVLRRTWQPRVWGWVVAVFAGIALSLAAAGTYGVLAFMVARRRRELGIRAALGASPWRLQRGVVAQAMALVSAGAVIGGLAAVAVTRVLQGLLFGVSPLDPATFAAGLVLLLAVAIGAAYLPARRAAGADPSVAFRTD